MFDLFHQFNLVIRSCFAYSTRACLGIRLWNSGLLYRFHRCTSDCRLV